MKNLLIVLLLVALAWLAWQHYARKPEIVTNTVTSNIRVVSAEKYGTSLRALADSLLGPLDTEAPNPVADLTKLSATADADLRNGRISPHDADVITRLCLSLKALNKERETYETDYRGILNRGYDSFQGRSGAEQKRQFFLDDLLRKWVAAAQSYRSQLSEDIAYLRDRERQWAYDEELRTTPPTVQ